MSKIIFYKTQTVELVVQGVSGGNTQGQLQFTPQTYLQGKKTTSLEIYTVSDLTFSPLQNALVTVAMLKYCYLTLYFVDKLNGAGQWMQNVPLWNLHRITNNTDPYNRDLFGLDGSVITWEKSFITVSNGTGLGNTSNLSFLFNVGYTD